MADAGSPQLPVAPEESVAEADAPPVPQEEPMHIHRPKPLHGAREIVTEIAVVVVGIAIALAAEQAVETLEWRHKIAESEQSMRAELSFDDGVQAFARAAITGCLNSQLGAIIAAVEAGRSGSEVARLTDAYQPPAPSWDRESWDSAVASGIGGHIGAQRLTLWARVYDLMPMLHDLTATQDQDLDLLAPGSEANVPLSAEQADRTLRAAKSLRRVNETMGSISMRMLRWEIPVDAAPTAARQASTLADARRRYGACVVKPDYRRMPETGDQFLAPADQARQVGLQ